MNCRDIEPLLLAERDGGLTAEQRAVLASHIANCPACRQLQAGLIEAMDGYHAEAAMVAVPAVDEEWRKLQARLRAGNVRPAKKRPLAPVIWFGSTLAAAAALALAYLSQPAKPATPTAQSSAPVSAQAEFVEAGDANASTMVYVDKESGWLVVWATDGSGNKNG